jgi:transposase
MARYGFWPIFWPLNSLDLNPIESLWDDMKDWIQENDLDIHRGDYGLLYSKLRKQFLRKES